MTRILHKVGFLSIAKTDMSRFISVAALFIFAAGAKAQDTTVVVRHLSPQQDTTVTVRHIGPQDQVRATAPYARPNGQPRYALGSAAAIARDPSTATSLSFFFPGAGQYYAGMPGKGLAITAVAIGAPIIGYADVNRQSNYCASNQGGAEFCRGHRDYTPAAIGLGVGITAWLYGIATAGTDAQRWNRAHGIRFVNMPGRVGFAVAVP
ncbi:MAG: hypothetical protein ACREN6_06220 [Gemmatimonadaceae bacterium]